MVEIDYIIENNNLSIGNRLFQYAFARILAEEKGWALLSTPIPGFPETGKAVTGQAYSAPTVALRGHVVNVQKLRGLGPARILLTDQAFLQRYSYYKQYKERIKRWYAPVSAVNVSEGDDLVIHLRLGDYLKIGWAVPYEHLNNIIDQITYDRIWIVTDDPQSVQMGQLRRAAHIKEIVHHADWLSDMQFIAKFDRILLTGSTFAWWAAWLSGAREIHFPLFNNGCWSFKRLDVDLFVDDEGRYKYYPEGASEPLNYEQVGRARNRLDRRAAFAVKQIRQRLACRLKRCAFL